VESYDPKEDRWTFIAAMRTPRARFQMAVLMVFGVRGAESATPS